MSLNRENIIWQSKDGTWSIGFYVCIAPAYESRGEDWDYEWDVDYDYDRFGWVSTGHSTSEAAELSWRGANPGSHNIAPYVKGDKEVAAKAADLDLMAWRFMNPEKAAALDLAERKKEKHKSRKESLLALEDVGRNATVNVRFGDGNGMTVTGALVTRGDWYGLEHLTQVAPNRKMGFLPVIKTDHSALHKDVFSASKVKTPRRDAIW